MQTEDDPNILYGGDPDDSINQGCASLGELILLDLKKGEERMAFVSFTFIYAQMQITVQQFNSTV